MKKHSQGDGFENVQDSHEGKILKSCCFETIWWKFWEAEEQEFISKARQVVESCNVNLLRSSKSLQQPALLAFIEALKGLATFGVLGYEQPTGRIDPETGISFVRQVK